jgi:hypothetical protein
MPASRSVWVITAIWIAGAIVFHDFSSPPNEFAMLFGVAWKFYDHIHAVTPPNEFAPQGSSVNLQEVAVSHNLKNQEDVRVFDETARNLYVACTYTVLNSGESNPIAIREQRISCLYSHGYSPNDVAYIGGKLLT